MMTVRLEVLTINQHMLVNAETKIGDLETEKAKLEAKIQ